LSATPPLTHSHTHIHTYSYTYTHTHRPQPPPLRSSFFRALTMPRARPISCEAAFIPTLAFVVCLTLSTTHFQPAAASLTANEVSALAELRLAFPALSQVPLVARRTDKINEVPSSWPSDLSTVCSGSDGEHIYGIICGAGHVSQITWYVYPPHEQHSKKMIDDIKY